LNKTRNSATMRPTERPEMEVCINTIEVRDQRRRHETLLKHRIDWQQHLHALRQPYQPGRHDETRRLLYSQDKLSNGGNFLENLRQERLKKALDAIFEEQWHSLEDIPKVKKIWQWINDG